MNERMLLRTLSQPKPRYIIPKRAVARAAARPAAPGHNAGAIFATAFVFWVVYFLMRNFGG